MTVVQLLGALGENQDFIIKTKEGETIDYKTAAEHKAEVLGVVAVRENLIRIDSNFSWYKI